MGRYKTILIKVKKAGAIRSSFFVVNVSDLLFVIGVHLNGAGDDVSLEGFNFGF